ncbi:hypothetical protein ACFC7A_31700 [Streptomyces niveus]|uniref:hypothetical protein n=1 Tax=Streptomyces niveus TaxID=193462 RepID=UPI0035E3171E
MTRATILDAPTTGTYRTSGSAAAYGWRRSGRGCPAEREGYFDLSPAALDAAIAALPLLADEGFTSVTTG